MSRSAINSNAPPEIHQNSAMPRGRTSMSTTLIATMAGSRMWAKALGIIAQS